MAEQKQQYESAADSIFDFIFKSARQNVKPEKKRPIPGVSGDEMAYALAEIAADPALYASEEVLSVVNEPLKARTDFGKVGIKLDKETDVKIGLDATNLADFINDPEGFIDGAFKRAEDNKKAARKLNMIRGLGGVMDLGIGALATRSLGVSSKESLKMGNVLGAEMLGQEARDDMAQEIAIRGSALEAAKAKGLDYKQANQLAQTFASVMESSKLDVSQFDKFSTGEKVQFKKVLEKKLRQQGVTAPEQIDELLNKYIDKAKRYKDQGDVKIESASWGLGSFDGGVRKDYAKGKDFTKKEEWISSENPADKIRALKFEELGAELSFFSALPNSDPRKRELIGKMEHIKTWQISNGHNMRFSRYLGEAHLNIQSFNEMVLKGGAIPGLITGDLFDFRKNNLAPSKEGKVYIPQKEGEPKVYDDIMLPRDDMRHMYTRLTGLYYLTPGSIGRTLFSNGEGFVYLQYLKQQKIKNMIKNSDSLFNYVSRNPNEFGSILGGMSIAGNQKAVLNQLAGGLEYVKLMKILENKRSSLTDAQLIRLYERMNKLHGKMQNSVLLKYADFISKYNPKALFSKAFGTAMVAILGKKLSEKARQALLSGKIGLRRLARGLAKKAVHAAAQAFGFATTGGLANALIFVATEVVVFIGEKLLKPIIKVAMFLVWCVIILLFIPLFAAFNFINPIYPFGPMGKNFDTAGNTAPIFCVQCGAGDIRDVYDIYPDDGPGGPNGSENGGGGDVDPPEPDSGESPPPAYSNVDCPLGSGSIGCSQGPYRGMSHGSRNAIDTLPPATAWYAPSDGEITRAQRAYENSRIPGQLCGGIVTFVSDGGVTHQLVHVVPEVVNGQEVRKGDLVARMAFERDGNINFSNASGTCATGPHFHLELLSGTSVYADRYYAEFLNCNLDACPGRPQFEPVEPGETSSCDEFKTFTGGGFVALGDSVIGVSQSSPPSITGNSQADSIIQGIAESRGYELRRDAGSFNSSARSAYSQMSSAAMSEAGLDLYLGSHYRSINAQKGIFLGQLPSECTQNNYANIVSGNCDSAIDNILKTFSAPGYSKHHTGYAIDLKCTSSGTYQGFKNTECYSWLSANNYCNAKRFGFIPSYPAGGGNQGPDPEEWEYLWVGVDRLKK